MNASIHSAYLGALVAHSAYVNGLVPRDPQLRAKLTPELTDKLAATVSAQFEVVTQWTDLGGSGFSVTVFADSSGSQHIAFRGTELGRPEDWITDLDTYLASGLARRQVIAMVNWYLRASTPAGAEVLQMLETPVVDQLTGEVLARTTLAQGEGTLAGAGNYVVSGHSLGGHLTTVFSRLFNDRVMSSSTYNGMGVGQSFPESFIDELETELGLGHTSWAAVDAKQKNYFAQHGISVAASDWWLQQRGERIALFVEQSGIISNHLMYKLTDALALYDVLGALDPDLSLADATKILNAASASAPASLETVLDALRRLYRTSDQTLSRISDVDGNDPRRDDFHDRLTQLHTAIGVSPLTSVRSLVGIPADQLRNLAINGDLDAMAYRYALKELNPFALLGPGALYTPHNAVGALALYVDANSTPAGMTAEYVTDRAAFLTLLLIGNSNDVTAIYQPEFGINNRSQYTDLKTGYTMTLSEVPLPPGSVSARRLVFGGHAAEVLSGGSKVDRLYGGAGADVLEGRLDNDYLEGGEGIDTYVYRAAGAGLLQPSWNDGDDEIRDTDGKGFIQYTFIGSGASGTNSRLVGGEAIEVAGGWMSLDGKFAYERQGADLRVRIIGDAGGSILIRDFDFVGAQEGSSFGIHLAGAPSTPVAIHEFGGDRRLLGSYFYTNPETGIGEWRDPEPIPYDEFGNTIRDPSLILENAPDTFHGSPGSDAIYGWGGADHLFGEEGDDLLYGGDGVDRIDGGGGDDVISGHDATDPALGSSDTLKGGEGNDRIYAGPVQDLTDAWQAANEVMPDDVRGGSSLTGDGGDDILIGSQFSDVIFGGPGVDLIVGGASTDDLHGDGGDDVLHAGAGGARMFGGAGNDMLFADDDPIVGSLLYGGEEDYAPGDGDDILFGSANGNDSLQGGDGADIVFANGGDDSFSDNLYAYFGPDIIFMGAGNDRVNASHGDDFIYGEDGDDQLNGGGGDDEIYGGNGNDHLHGGGNLAALASSYRGGSPVYVDIASGDDALFGEEGNDVLDGDRGDDALFGDVGDDVLRGGFGADLLHGGPGNDRLEGGVGEDVYVIERDDGLDTIHDVEIGSTEIDAIFFGEGIAPADLTLFRSSADLALFIVIADSEARIDVPRWFTDDEEAGRLFDIESFRFADGNVWDSADIESHVVVATGPTPARDLLTGTVADDLIHALEGADQITDAAGNDILFGDEHSDSITDSAGHNLLVGGTGDDILRLNGVPIHNDEGEVVGVEGGAPGSIVIGGMGLDTVAVDDHSVVAYNLGDSEDTISWRTGEVQVLTISVGAAVAAEDISISRDLSRVMVNLGPEIPSYWFGDPVPQEAIALPNVLEARELWPSLVLQVIGNDIRTYDLGQVLVAYFAALEQDPEIGRWSAAEALHANLLGTSTTHAMGGAIAYQYATTGAVEGLTPDQIRSVLVGADFGLAPQPIELASSNSAPILNGSVADQAADEDAPFAFTVSADAFSDPDAGDALTYSAALEDGSALPGWLAFDGETRTFSGKPLQSDVGSLQVTVTAKDTGGLSATDTFTLTIANVNDAPLLASPIADVSFEAGTSFSFGVPEGTFSDEDPNDTFDFAATRFDGGALPAWLSFDPEMAVFSGSPALTDIGISHILVTAVDAAGASAQSDFGLVVRVPAGMEATGTAGDDVIYGGTGDETLTAKGGSDYLYGDVGNDLLKGGGGNDVLQGGAGNDVLRGGKGQNVLDGGLGDDLIFGGAGSAFIMGGAGNDTLRVGSGNDVIAFNAGDGMDTVYGGRDGGNTLSFGGGIRYSDLTLSKSGKDLVVSTGAGEGVTLKNWYAGNHSVLNLQIVLDATEEFDAGSSDPLYNRRVQTFDFLGMVSAYDAARAATPGLTSWEMTNALLAFHLSGADDMALGGDLAYWYGKNRTLAGISLQSAQHVIGAANFGSEAQSLRPFNGLQEGFVKLA